MKGATMSKINYEITLYHSPYHDTLVEELSNLIKQKKSIYRKIKSEKDFETKLSFEEREILKHLIAKEDKILMELVEHKGWIKRVADYQESFSSGIDEDIEYRAHYLGF